ncbi:histone deacetylase family protein [Alcaligenaceae bacterium]|nr:histone deacetylase family protein [Alcaligenaceae bacterium]
MLFTYSNTHAQHAPSTIIVRGNPIQNWEQPARAEQLQKYLESAGHDAVPTQEWDRKWIAAVHTPDYLTFLESAYERWQQFIAKNPEAGKGPAGSAIHAHVFAHHSARQQPSSIQGQVGYYLSGGSCPLDQGTWAAALGSANTALTAASLLQQGVQEAYALCRPPGHHAYADMAGGFCYLNNAAIAANYLAKHMGRVAILDVDAHHGNGTQSIFYERNDVHFVSIHGDPNVLFPFYAGYPHERGHGAGLGYNLNIPLPLGTEDDAFMAAVNHGMSSILNYAPGALVVSLGFDPFLGDPSAGLAVSTEGFRTMGKAIARYQGPILLIQEGGYVIDHLAANLSAFLDGFLGSR